MSKYVALRDRRLEGGVPSRPMLGIVNTDGGTPLSSACKSIGNLGKTKKIEHMFVFCHGFAGSNPRARISTDAGGMGLLLGQENVLHANVAMWTAIRNKVKNIIVYACAAADTQAGNKGTRMDGRYLMGALAIHTNATVYAADRIQWYATHNDAANGAYDFGAWEGNLWRFKPDGYSVDLVARVPTEFSDVLAGR